MYTLGQKKRYTSLNWKYIYLQTLKKISSHLIDIHSQHQTIELVNDSFQFEVVIFMNMIFFFLCLRTLFPHKWLVNQFL